MAQEAKKQASKAKKKIKKHNEMSERLIKWTNDR